MLKGPSFFFEKAVVDFLVRVEVKKCETRNSSKHYEHYKRFQKTVSNIIHIINSFKNLNINKQH